MHLLQENKTEITNESFILYFLFSIQIISIRIKILGTYILARILLSYFWLKFDQFKVLKQLHSKDLLIDSVTRWTYWIESIKQLIRKSFFRNTNHIILYLLGKYCPAKKKLDHLIRMSESVFLKGNFHLFLD
jgi:hypothetical protein